MTTYLVTTSTPEVKVLLVAVLAANKAEAYEKAKAAFPGRKVLKSSVIISAGHISTSSYEKVY